MSTLDDVVNGKHTLRAGYVITAPVITCADGVRVSVQASSFHYCSPRSDVGPYTSVEVGFPSVSPPDSWADYFEGDWNTDDHTQSVYGWVPAELVKEFVESHGGEVDA